MVAWGDYTTGERIKWLRGSMTQQELAEAASLSVHLVQKAEQGKTVSLASLMKIANALGSDVSVLLGEQAPRRTLARDESIALRAISAAAHEAGGGRVADVEPGDLVDLRAAFESVWTDYWNGRYAALGVTLPGILREVAAIYQGSTGQERVEAAKLLADAFQLAGHFANNLSARDLAYATIVYAQQVVQDASDELRAGRLDAVLSWIYLRDGNAKKAMTIAGDAAARIEPRFSDGDTDRLAVFGNLMTNAAVAASRGGGDNDTARAYTSQANAAAARMTGEVAPYGAIFGPGAAVTQAVSVALALGDTGHALSLIDGARFNISDLLPSSQARYHLDIALARCETRKWDLAIKQIQMAHQAAPAFTRTQGLTTELVRRIGDASTANVKRLSATIGVPYIGR